MSAQPDQKAWEAVLAAGVAAQKAVPGCIAVGGTAAALYAKHRYSQDTDHLLPDLRDRFEEVQEQLERTPGWTTARVQPPVLILGSINGVQVGFRQSRRKGPVETSVVQTWAGPLTVPTLCEIMGMKAYMAYARNTTRDYVDFAALASLANDSEVLACLLRSDERYGELQSKSVGLEIAKRLTDPRPYDLSEVNLHQYKGLEPPWDDWSRVAVSCRHHGDALVKALLPRH